MALKGDLEAIRIALAIAEERASAAEGGRTRLLAERDAALVEAAKLREERGAAQGEVEGLKLGLEHAHGHVATARQEATAARTEAQEAQRKAAAADQTARSLKADLERLRGRGLLARLINRPR